MLICNSCGRDIDAMGQDNCSYVLGEPLCEDCAGVSNYDLYLGTTDYEPSDEEVEA